MMLSRWLFLLLVTLPLRAAGEDAREPAQFPAIESAEESYGVLGTARASTVVRAAAASHASDSAPGTRQDPVRRNSAEWTIATLVAAARGVTIPEPPPSQARQRRMLPWPTAPPAFA